MAGEESEVRIFGDQELNNAFVAHFAGNIVRTHDLETLVDAAFRLRDDSGVAFLLIGSGSKSSYVRRTVDEHGLTNVRVLGFQPRADLPTMLTACDMAVVRSSWGWRA